MQLSRVRPMAIVVAFVLSVVIAFFAGTAFGAEPSVTRTTAQAADRTQASEFAAVPAYVSGGDVANAVLAQLWRVEAWGRAVQTAMNAKAQQAAVPVQSSAAPVRTGAGGCDGHVVPSYILQRESGCSYDAYNPTGCGGSGCIGLYQLDAKHFNNTCAGLDTSPAGQDACAQRLVDAGGLSPWGG